MRHLKWSGVIAQLIEKLSWPRGIQNFIQLDIPSGDLRMFYFGFTFERVGSGGPYCSRSAAFSRSTQCV